MVETRDRIFYNQTMDKSSIKQLIGRLVAYRGSVYTAHILDQLKTLGFQHSTQTGVSLGIDDLLASPLKSWIIQDAEYEATMSQEYCRHGCIHAVERLRQIVETWHTTSEFLKREMTISFNMLDSLNPVHMMSFSGARGNTSQVHQLVGMRGLMSDPQGNIIDLPIQSNLREGLSLTEYIISCYGARKGVVDTAIRTADAGYLTRRLVEVAQHVVVRNVDCNTPWGVYLRSIRGRQGSSHLSCETRLVGRVLARPVYMARRCLANRNQDIDANLASNLVLVHQQGILIRSPLACKNTDWACQLCYGWGGSYNKMVELGEAIGIIAGQSIGEPGTQLTLRTFHTGGVFTGDITHQIRAPLNGIVHFDSKTCQTTRNRHGRLAWKCFEDLPIVIKGPNTNNTLIIPAHSLLLINNNQCVSSKQVIAEVRASVAPLKETVQRHIYSHLQGEVMHTRSAWRLSGSLDSSRFVTNSSTLHVWVWSGQMSEIVGQKVSTIYRSEDYVEMNVPIAKQNGVFNSDQILGTHVQVAKSTLIGNFTYSQQMMNIDTGTIRLMSIKTPASLRTLILSTVNQLKVAIQNNKLSIGNTNLSHETNASNIGNTVSNTNLIDWLIFPGKDSHFTLLLIKIFYRLGLLANKSYAMNKPWSYSIGLIGQLRVSLQQSCYTVLINTTYTLFTKTSLTTGISIYKRFTKMSFYWRFVNEYTNFYGICGLPNAILRSQLHNNISSNFFTDAHQFPQLGQLIWKGTSFEHRKQLSESGNIICIFKHNITLRFIQPFLLAGGAVIHVDCYDVIHEGDMLITLMYEQLKTSDIVQGLPKAEQLLEARSINEIVLKLENDFLTLTEHIARQLPSLSRAYNVNTRNSTKHSQLELVNRIQTVYLSQGVRILDKHIEVIVRQMSSKAMLVENEDPLAISSGGLICLPLPHMDAFVLENWIEIPLQYAIDNHAFLPGEVIELARAQKMHYVLQNSIAHRPMLLGITKASLTTKSFLAEASFQRTARVLSKSALQGRVDWIKGLQENVLFGGMIPAGTGCREVISELQFVNEVITERCSNVTSKLFVNRLYGLNNFGCKQFCGFESLSNSNLEKTGRISKHHLLSTLVEQSIQYASKYSVHKSHNSVNVVSKGNIARLSAQI